MHTPMSIPVFIILVHEEDKPGKDTAFSIGHQASHLRREIDQSADRPCWKSLWLPKVRSAQYQYLVTNTRTRLEAISLGE